ncbi:N-methyl-L-tryptophan oxidase [Tundrisphaera lichenicola]|uniref:N-methyl-L-tryptophan oxidase n=1 Tax=Tundrisphaera lichenicola TaxID=2029860 RepID=UPI003EC01EC2
MSTRHVPAVILGAGAMGAATAYHMARRDQPFILVEQFTLGHDRGSSHGAARITRHSYADPAYARLMIDAFQAWRELEADSGRSLYIRTGGVSISPRGTDYVANVARSLEAIKVPFRRMTGTDLNRILPTFGVEADSDVVFEPDAGILAAREAIRAEIDTARRLGGDRTQIIEQAPILHLDLEGKHPALILAEETLSTDHLIITAGAWTGRLIPKLASKLRPTRQQVLYFRPSNPSPFAIGRFPVFIYKGEADDDAYYGMPESLGMGVKVARHDGPEVDPDQVGRIVEEDYRTVIRQFLRRTIPVLADSASDHEEVCLYTMSRDEEFRVGLLPGRTDVIVASPCSGHGFKFSCLIGRVLADLVIDGHSRMALDSWRLDRS